MAKGTAIKVIGGLALSAIGVGIAISKCPPCRDRFKKMMMENMKTKMPEMMEKCMKALGPEMRTEMVAHCKTTLDEVNKKIEDETTEGQDAS